MKLSPSRPKSTSPARTRARGPFRWLRRVLLLAGIFGVLALGFMLAAYNFGGAERSLPRETVEVQDENMVTASEGVNYVQTNEGKRVFSVLAARSLQNRDDVSQLEEVTLEIDREEGGFYNVSSDQAWLNARTHNALLEGNVVMSGWGDLIIEARALEIQQQAQVMESRGAVEFRYPPDLIGRASQLHVDRRTNTITLSGGVHIRSVPSAEVPLRLDCVRLFYNRDEGLVRAVEDVKLQYGNQEIQAHFLSLFLMPDQSTVKTVRARWEVRGFSRDGNGFGDEVRYTGQFLEVEPQPANPSVRRLRLEGTLAEPAEIRSVQADGLTRELSGKVLKGWSEGEKLSRIDGVGAPLMLNEYLDFDPPFYLRKTCAGRAVAGFLPNGDLGQLVLEGDVDMRDPGLQVSGGDRAIINVADGQMELTGKSVELYTDRGDIIAPHITYSRSNGRIKADSGVETTLAQIGDTFGGTPLIGGDGPVRVQSQEAMWTTNPRGFAFLGDVRAWRGQNLLLADQLRGDEEKQEMSASGGVKTVWQPERPGPGAEAVEVNAKTMSFRRPDNSLVYYDGVQMKQGRRTLDCGEMTVLLGPGGSEAERMTCRRKVKLVDPIGNQRVTGDTAIYSVAQDQVEVLGDRVRLVDSSKNEFFGRYLIYDLESGEASLSQREKPTQATGSQ